MVSEVELVVSLPNRSERVCAQRYIYLFIAGRETVDKE
jgi:hypothetical protein